MFQRVSPSWLKLYLVLFSVQITSLLRKLCHGKYILLFPSNLSFSVSSSLNKSKWRTKGSSLILPVVIKADLMTAGNQSGWADFRRAVTPDTWGHDIDVPDWKFQHTERVSVFDKLGGVSGGHAANMFTPGAVISGCPIKVI